MIKLTLVFIIATVAVAQIQPISYNTTLKTVLQKKQWSYYEIHITKSVMKPEHRYLSFHIKVNTPGAHVVLYAKRRDAPVMDLPNELLKAKHVNASTCSTGFFCFNNALDIKHPELGPWVFGVMGDGQSEISVELRVDTSKNCTAFLCDLDFTAMWVYLALLGTGSVIIPLIALVGSFLLASCLCAIVERKRRKRVALSSQRFVAPHVVETPVIVPVDGKVRDYQPIYPQQ